MNFLAELKVLLNVVMIKVPIVEFRFRRLHRPAILSGDMASEQAAIAWVLISLAALFLLCFPLSYLGFISAHTAAFYFTSRICCICLMLP
jgi:hypothetical protein